MQNSGILEVLACQRALHYFLCPAVPGLYGRGMGAGWKIQIRQNSSALCSFEVRSLKHFIRGHVCLIEFINLKWSPSVLPEAVGCRL